MNKMHKNMLYDGKYGCQNLTERQKCVPYLEKNDDARDKFVKAWANRWTSVKVTQTGKGETSYSLFSSALAE